MGPPRPRHPPTPTSRPPTTPTARTRRVPHSPYQLKEDSFSCCPGAPPSYDALYGEFRAVRSPGGFAAFVRKVMGIIVGTGKGGEAAVPKVGDCVQCWRR